LRLSTVRYFPPRLKPPPPRQIASFVYHQKQCGLEWVRRGDGSELFVLTCPVCSRRLNLGPEHVAIISLSEAGALVRTLSRVDCPAPCVWSIVISLGVVYDVARSGNGRDESG
jgi:hypothetical protein